MLTLDETTLFFYTLFHSSSKQKAFVENWQKVIHYQTKPSGTSDVSSTLVTSHVNHTSHAKSLKTSQDKGLHLDEYMGGVADRDETTGPEEQAAMNSPPKNGKRLTSEVN